MPCQQRRQEVQRRIVHTYSSLYDLLDALSMESLRDPLQSCPQGPELPAYVENERIGERLHLVALLTRACERLELLWNERCNALRTTNCTATKIERIDRRFITEIRKLDRLVTRFHALDHELPPDLHRTLSWLFLNLCLGDAGVTLRDLDLRSTSAQRLTATLLDRERYEGRIIELAREAAGVKRAEPEQGVETGCHQLFRPLAAYEEIFQPIDRLLRAYHLDDSATSAGVDLVPVCSGDVAADAGALHGVVRGFHSRSVHARALMALAEAIRPLYAAFADRVWWDHYRPRFLATVQKCTPESIRQLYIEAILCTTLMPTERGCSRELLAAWTSDAFDVGYGALPFAGAEWNAVTDVDWDALWLELWSRVARDRMPLSQLQDGSGRCASTRTASLDDDALSPPPRVASVRLPVVEALAQKILESLEMPSADFSYIRAEKHGAPECMRFAVGSNCAERRLRASVELLIRQIGAGFDPQTMNERILTALERLLALADIAIHPSHDGIWVARFGIFMEALAQTMFERFTMQYLCARSGIHDRLTECPQEMKRQLGIKCVSRIIFMITGTLERALLSANRTLAKRARRSLRLLLRMLPPAAHLAQSPNESKETLDQTGWARDLFQKVVVGTFQQESKASRRAAAMQVASILVPYLLPPLHVTETDGLHGTVDLAKNQETEGSLLVLLDYVLEGTSASDAAFSEAAYRFCTMFISCVKNRAEDASGDAKQGIVFLSPEAHAFWVTEWIPRFTERLFDVLDSLERADSNPGGARLQRLEWMITAISELLQKQGQQTPVHASAWYRLFIEGAVDDRLARERPLENATKEWAIIVRALCASASDSVHRRMLMDRLLGLASAENVLPSLKAWRLRLLGQACRRYPDPSELARCYGSTIGHLAMSACSAHGERALYKAGGKLFRGLMQGLSDTWSQSVHICPLSEDEQWRRVKTLWDQGYALHQSCQRVCWQQIHVMWRQPTLDAIEKAWSLFEENLAAIQRVVGDQRTTVDPDRAKAVARWLFSLRRAARWLLSGKKRVDTDSLVSSDNVSESSDADDWFDALDDIDTTTAPGTDSKGDSGPANTWDMRLTNWTPLQGNASGFIDWLPSNASQLLEQWRALVLQVAVAADPDTLQREALRPFEIAHQGFEYDGPRAQRSGRGRFRRQFALQALDEHMIDAAPWTLLRGPDLVIESLALAALEHRRSFAARAGAFAIASRDPELAVISFPNSLLKLLLSERGVLSDYPGIAQRARSLLLPACRYLSPRAMESQVLNPIWRELDYSANTYDEVALFQHRVRLESIFILLDALLPRLCSEAALFRTTIAVVLRSGCRGSWMTSVPQVHGLAMTLLMKACLRVRRLSVLGAPRSCGEDARCTEPNLDHQLRESDFATMLANVAKMGVYVEPEEHLADTAAAPRLAWLARAVAALLLVYDDLVDCAHWRNLGIQDQSSQVAQSWRRALEAAFSLANDKHRAALRQIGVLLISRLCACGIVTEDASKSSWISCIDVQELVRSMYCDAKGPLHLFISSSTSPIDAATAVSKGADLWSAIVSSVAELVPGTGAAAHLATASSVFVVTDAVSSWELVSGGPAWPRLWDGRLGTSAMISRRAGEHWTFPMLARVRCLEHLHHLMNEQERQRVSWYMDGDSDLSAASTASVELDEIERLRRLEHEILIATAIRDMNRLGRCIMKCTSQSVWRSLAVPALRYLADHARSAQAVITEEMLYHDLVLEPMSSRGLWESDPWGALLDEGAQADSNAVLRALNCLEALGRFAPPDGLRYEYLMGRASSAERDAAASTLAVWVANHSSLLAHVLETWRAFITGLEQAASSGIANTETIVAERLFAARDTLVGFLQRACYWRQHDMTESLQSLEPSLIDWCLRQLSAVIVLDGGDTNGVSSRRGNTGAGASLRQREALAQRARSTWYLLAQSRSPTLLHRALAHAAELLANSRTWSVRSTAINAIHLALNDYPFLIQRQRSLVQDTHFAGSAFRWFDDLMPFLSDTEIAVRKAAAQALASWCRWFVPNAADGDDEDALYERIVKNRWCNPNPSVDEFARALVLSCLIQSHPYDVRPRWMSDALGAMVMLAETPSGPTKQAVAVSRRREAAQAARRCLQSFCHMHRAQWTREQEQLDPSIRELLSDLWLGSPYVV